MTIIDHSFSTLLTPRCACGHATANALAGPPTAADPARAPACALSLRDPREHTPCVLGKSGTPGFLPVPSLAVSRGVLHPTSAYDCVLAGRRRASRTHRAFPTRTLVLRPILSPSRASVPRLTRSSMSPQAFAREWAVCTLAPLACLRKLASAERVQPIRALLPLLPAVLSGHRRTSALFVRAWWAEGKGQDLQTPVPYGTRGYEREGKPTTSGPFSIERAEAQAQARPSRLCSPSATFSPPLPRRLVVMTMTTTTTSQRLARINLVPLPTVSSMM
ncbi:hypothetical protein B0H14DRAFT_3894840 [Mycena olivaceomarginata]|nr:hypothetical protein B0H14DRAFT_3895850 [Mycena olivaceomarginata]KAJ7770363.1 hypothetical protein B0H14DRAFT_3894840 [Mycena olivaceomarginata]